MTEYANITSNVKFLPAQIGNVPITMSSREIAELVNSRHDKVKQSIDRLVARGVIVQPPLGDEHFTDSLGRPRTEQVYRIGKRDSYVIVAQLSPEFTARLVDRWQELEEGTAKPVPVSSSVKELAAVFSGCKQIARLAGFKGNQLILSAAQAARKITGRNPLDLVDATHLLAEVQEQYLGPRQIGEREVPPVTAQRVNKALAAAGLQIEHRKSGKHAYWELADAGKRAGGEYLDTGKKHGDGTPVRQIKWPASVVDRIRQHLAAA